MLFNDVWFVKIGQYLSETQLLENLESLLHIRMILGIKGKENVDPNNVLLAIITTNIPVVLLTGCGTGSHILCVFMCCILSLQHERKERQNLPYALHIWCQS